MGYLQKTHFKYDYINGLKVKDQRDIPRKYESKESWSRYIIIGPNRFRRKDNH